MTSTAPRQSEHPIEPAFLQRWSPRAFTAEPISRDALMRLFEAARWAPSGSNHQPWRFAYALRGTPAFEAYVDALVPFNAAWARHAAALVVVASAQRSVPPGASELKSHPSHAFDTGAAWMQLALQARADGWATHAMGGFDHAKARAAVGASDDLVLHAVVAVGRQGAAGQLSADLQAREHPNGRQPVSAFVVEGAFGAAS